MRRQIQNGPSTLGTAPLAPDCEAGQVLDPTNGACVADPCSSQSEFKRYAGWGLLGLIAGGAVGQVLFKQHPMISAAAGLLGGVAWAAGDTLEKCSSTKPAA